MKPTLKNLLVISLTTVLSSSLFASQQRDNNNKKVELKLVETADVHGNFFSYDYINSKPLSGGLARVSSYIKELRAEIGDKNAILIENGDLLQGQPCVYYGNFIDSTSNKLLASRVLNYVGYNIANFGNHDVEAGHPVYDRWIQDCDFPVLGANIISNNTGLPYAKPYAIMERDGVKIAYLGLVTSQVPLWLPEKLWSGTHFTTLKSAAELWIPFIQKNEKPDIIVGVIHQGVGSHTEGGVSESSCADIAKEVPGFDIIFMGHDHRPYNEKVKNEISGEDVLIINAGGGAENVAVATIECSIKNNKVESINIDGELIDMDGYEPDAAMMAHFAEDDKKIKEFTNNKIGYLKKDIKALDYYFGNSDMGNLLHNTQFNITDAEISIIAPLSTNAIIKSGDIFMKDIFKLYKYENMINTMELTGREIKGCLEMGYGTLCTDMKSSNDHIILMREYEDGSFGMKNYTSSMVTAAGITYEVDVTKPVGEKINIISTSKGEPFNLDKTYLVAINSYIGSGAGGLLTLGAGIERSKLPARIISTTSLDFRYYIADYIKQHGNQSRIKECTNWKFVPEKLVKKAIKKDYKLLEK